MKKILYMQNYAIESPERRAEVDRCIQNNLALGFDDFVLFNENIPETFASRNVRNIALSRRLAFQDFLQQVSLPQNHGALHVLCNSDICLHESIFKLDNKLKLYEAVCLSRHEPAAQGTTLTPNPFASQDTWGLVGCDIPTGLLCQTNFSLGLPGCENRFAELLGAYGYSHLNPCKDILSTHIHQNHQGMDDNKRLYGSYAFVFPCAFDDPSDRPNVQYAYWMRGAPIRLTFRVSFD